MFIPAVLSLQSLLTIALAQRCKTYPGDSSWPDQTAWQTLNNTVSGRLVTPVALAAACRPDSFNNVTCAYVSAQWSNTSWVAENPWIADYNDDTCAPDPTLPCSTQGYPAYVIEAVNAEDVKAGVDFARQNNIRLIVKGTGHDFPGRSSGAGSLSIWTHQFRGIDIALNDPTALRYGGVAAVKIGAGYLWREIYAELAERNLTIVGGADGTVGIGGWVLNGGHSPVSSLYGLGADQILSLEVVTADGQLLTVNETSYADLFWALRGAGGSTYAVMLSVTLKAYPRLPAVLQEYYLVTTANSDTYWALTAYMHTQVPTINEAGGMGYYYVVPGSALDPSLANSSVFAGVWIFPNRDEAYVNGTLAPIYAAIQKAAWAVDPISITANNTYTPNFLSFWLNNPPENAGSVGRLGSWLLDGPALANQSALQNQLKAAAYPTGYLLGHVIAGPGVRNAVSVIPGGSNAVLPAWRKAYVHLVIPTSWQRANETEKAFMTADLRNRAVPALKQLAPDSGAYINEADPSNPEWKHDYFGANYDKLLEVKNKYDPDGVFWCKPCVGWDDEWEIQNGPADEDVLEWGIGQGAGRLCQKA